MSKREWFFKRGNARLSWETLPEWAEFVAVDLRGRVFAYSSKPTCGSGHWLESSNLFDEVAYTDCICKDWQSLIFERPKLESTLITGVQFVDAATFAENFAKAATLFKLRTSCKPEQDKNFSIRVICACGEEVLVDNEPIYGVWAKRSYVIPCPNCHAHLKIRVKYEAAD